MTPADGVYGDEDDGEEIPVLLSTWMGFTLMAVSAAPHWSVLRQALRAEMCLVGVSCRLKG